MDGMLGSIARDQLIIPRVTSERKRGLDNVVAWLHEHEDALDFFLAFLEGHAGSFTNVLDEFVLDDLTGPVEEILDHVEELWIGRNGHLLEPVRDLMVGVGPACEHPANRVRAGHLLRESPQIQHHLRRSLAPPRFHLTSTHFTESRRA